MGLLVSTASVCGGRRRLSPSSTPPAPLDLQPELVRVFRRFDTDGDGHISAVELREVCGCSIPEAEAMVTEADGDGDGFISLEEFVALMQEGEGESLREAFEAYDEDGDGVITVEELQHALLRLGVAGEEATAERCAEMVRVVDSDGDGVVSFEEFKAMMAAKRA